MQPHDDFRAKARQRFVDGVIHNFIYAVVQAPGIGGADVHAGALAHGLQAFQHLNLRFVIMSGALQLLGIHFHFVSHMILPLIVWNLGRSMIRHRSIIAQKWHFGKGFFNIMSIIFRLFSCCSSYLFESGE